MQPSIVVSSKKRCGILHKTSSVTSGVRKLICSYCDLILKMETERQLFERIRAKASGRALWLGVFLMLGQPPSGYQ